MKTQMFRVWALGVALSTLALGAGCQEEQARAEVPDIDKLVPEIAPANTTPDLALLEPSALPLDLAAAGALEKTNVSTNMPKLVANPSIPPDLKVSPALEEILKLAQAGVSEEVMLAYVAHSTTFFDVTSDAVVYLNDLGVSDKVITALIHHDSTPEMQARKQAAIAVQPLPPGVALTTPATNVYPPSVSQTAPPPPAPDSTFVAPVETNYVEAQPVEEPATVSYFYSSLAPYGTWLEVDGYGLCWQPTVVVSNPRWRPYSDRGRWLWSDHGWYWYSDYSWGWAPFHYGRWCDYPRVGWIWVPDYHWGPSWVSWRYSSSYCGWAPLPPSCHYRPGFGFSYYGSSVGWGFDFGLSFHHYNYVPFNRFCDRSPGLHVLRGERVRGIHRDTTVVNNYVVGNNNTIINNGIGRDRVASATRGQIPTARVREANTRASTRHEQLVNEGSSLAIVRPSLPARPERSHVNVPTRPITRVSATEGQAVVPNSGGLRANSSGPGVGRRSNGSGGVNRDTTPPSVSRTPSADTTPSATENRSRSSVPENNRGSRPTVLATPRSSSEAVRPNSPASRSYAAPRSSPGDSAPARNESAPSVNNNNNRGNNAPAANRSAPPAANQSASRSQSAPSSSVNRSGPPAASRPVVPNSPAARGESYRVYANPGANSSRPAAPAQQPNVSRSAPSSAPAQSRPSYSAPASRPEPSRSAPSVSRPEPSRPAPSYSAPSRPSQSYSAPAQSAPSRPSAPSYSAPVRPNSPASSGGGSGSGGGSRSESRGRGRD